MLINSNIDFYFILKPKKLAGLGKISNIINIKIQIKILKKLQYKKKLIEINNKFVN